jgi:hypothetical protein
LTLFFTAAFFPRAGLPVSRWRTFFEMIQFSADGLRWSTVRVTRLGEFSPVGQLFPLSEILKIIYRSVPDFGLLFITLLLAKMGWSRFRAIFSQTYLVTLSTVSGRPQHNTHS